MTTRKKARICITVPDANDVNGSSIRDETQKSPLLHSAVHNLLDGFRAREDVEIEVAYGRMHPDEGEDRWEGCIHYVPVRYKPFPVPGMGGPYLARTLALLRYIRKTKPDLVHGQGTERESGLVAALAGPPSILTLHGNFREISKTIKAKPMSYYWLSARIEDIILPLVTGVHCISSHTKRSVESKARRTWVIPNAVDSRFFAVERQPTAYPNIVCIAAITEWKNPLLLVQASDAVQKAFPDSKIHFFGACNKEHPYGREFLGLISLRPWCIYHGQCDVGIIIEHLSTATCAVLPSKQENFGLALAEALACGVPSLGANCGGIPDVIRQGETGFLFNPENPSELSNIITSLHGDETMMTAMSQRAKEDAARRFSCRSVADAHVAMYRDALSTQCS